MNYFTTLLDRSSTLRTFKVSVIYLEVLFKFLVDAVLDTWYFKYLEVSGYLVLCPALVLNAQNTF